MHRRIARTALVIGFVLVGMWAVSVPAGAADLYQGSPSGDMPPAVESFDYLFAEPAPGSVPSADATGEGGAYPLAEPSPGAESSPDDTDGEGDAPGLGTTSVVPRIVAPYIVSPYGLAVSVDRGCGGVYSSGEYIGISTFVPETGYLTVWSSTGGSWWRRMRGPMWVRPGTIPVMTGYIAPPVGNELIFARLYTPDGRVLEHVCHFYSVGAPYVPPPYVPPVVPPYVPPVVPPYVPPTPPYVPPYNIPLQCYASVPMEVAPGVAFSQIINVYNPQYSAAATGVMLYARISPTGLLPIYSCSPNCSVTTGLLTASLGTLYPGETRTITIDAYGPQMFGQRFDLWYSTRGNQLPEQTCATAGFTVGAVMFLAPGAEEAP